MCDLHDTAESLRSQDMIQTARKLEGELSPCPDCMRQPFHIHVRGRNLHFLECPPCELRTTKHPTLQQAVDAWERLPRTEAA